MKLNSDRFDIFSVDCFFYAFLFFLFY